MTMNPLPPQAYTKDTLTKAYMWLAHQSDSIKELATTPDILVSLFLKAQRNGEEALDAPSIQNFKKELKNLAGLMGELESQNNPAQNTTYQPALATKVAEASKPASQMNHPSPHLAPVDLVSQLDPKSKNIISEVREQLNLSNDVEVVRLLISLGYHKAKNLYS